MNEQQARYKWSDYVSRVRVAAVLEGQKVDADASVMRLAKKDRKNALDAYLKTLIG